MIRPRPLFVLTLAMLIAGCGGSSGNSSADSAPPSSPTPAAPTVNITANPASITTGASSTLTVTAANATGVSVSGSDGSSYTLPSGGGAESVSLTATATYTATATGAGGTASSAVTVTVSSPVLPPPTVTLAASPATITSGSSSTLAWTSTNATSVSIDPSIGTGTLPLNGSAPVSPLTTTTYTITATSAQGKATASATVTVNPLPPGTPHSAITHLIVVILQNHSFDNLFGTFPSANGLDPSLPSYTQTDANGNTVTPTLLTNLNPPNINHDSATYTEAWDNGKMDKYALTNGDVSMDYFDNTVSGTAKDGKTFSVETIWNYARQYVLADNFFASALNSEPANMLYMIAATVHDARTAGSLPYYDKCSPGQKASGGGTIAVPLTETNVGDQMNAAGVSWIWYQGNYSTSQSGTCVDYVPQENPFQYFTSTEYSANLQDFSLTDFQTSLTNGTVPSVSFITAAPSVSMHPGSGNEANGIEWLQNLVQDIQNSPVWPSTAIVVFWDESGGWYDHVSPPQLPNTFGLGPRVPVIIISPFAKTGAISHQQMDYVSILRFIQWNWGLGMFTAPAQSAREQQSGDICDMLTSACSSP